MDELTSIPQILTDLVFRGSLSRHTSKNDEYNILKTFFKCITKFDLKKKKGRHNRKRPKSMTTSQLKKVSKYWHRPLHTLMKLCRA